MKRSRKLWRGCLDRRQLCFVTTGDHRGAPSLYDDSWPLPVRHECSGPLHPRPGIKDRIEASYHLLAREDQVPLISYVTEAEIRSLALQLGWGPPKREQLDFLLTAFRRVPVEPPEILNAYVLIDAYSTQVGHDMGKNDIWIAATARATKATLLTADRDFDHLQGVFLQREWIDPDQALDAGSPNA